MHYKNKCKVKKDKFKPKTNISSQSRRLNKLNSENSHFKMTKSRKKNKE